MGVVDTIATLAVVLILLGMSVPTSVAFLDRERTVAAARYLASAVAQARLAAMGSGDETGLYVAETQQPASIPLIRDGDGDGVNLDDYRAGVDPLVRALPGLDAFRNVGLCIGSTGPSPDGGEVLVAGSRAVRVGRDSMLHFTPRGTGSSGTVYVCSAGSLQAAVRVFGATGRVRVLVRDASGAWRGV